MTLTATMVSPAETVSFLKSLASSQTLQNDSSSTLSDDKTEKMSPTDIDARHPVYLGEWTRALPAKDDKIAMDDTDEPHIKRRHAILAAHPEVKTLYGIEKATKWITIVLVSTQIYLAYFFGHSSPDQFVSWGLPSYSYYVAFALASYIIGGSIASIMGVVMHEAAHCLCFKSVFANRCFALFANMPIPFPIAQSFRRYHLDHHAYQGIANCDPDLPMEWEVKLIRGNALSKILWIGLYPAMYVIRGAAMQKTPSKWEIINVTFSLIADAIITYVCGLTGLGYLVASLWAGYSLHPGAAHFIQEHYTFASGQETYSYYGWMNTFWLNVGYHNEHHDFTKIPYSRLPTLKAMAPEFYDSLAAHDSWFGVLYNFIIDPTMAPISRLGRTREDHRKGRKQVPALARFYQSSKSKLDSDFVPEEANESSPLVEGEVLMDQLEAEALNEGPDGLRLRMALST